MATSSSLLLSSVDLEHNGHKQAAYATPPHILSHRTSKPKTVTNEKEYKLQIVWRNVLIFVILHSVALYGAYLVIAGYTQVKTNLFIYAVGTLGGFGITVGAHRLWAHKCYNARLPMRIVLAILQTLALQNCIYEWVRDHRVHHKFTDTDADPHNSTRGFFFSHMGWLMVRKHPDVKLKGSTVHMKDMEDDAVVMWQKKHYLWIVPIVTFLIPSLIPYYLWNERYLYSFIVIGISRYVLSLHFTWLVNSAAHIWGTKPYDKNISPTENRVVAVLAYGEGWHNYHHAFPWDYKAAELGNYRMNLSTAIIDLSAKLGLAYNLKTADPAMIEKRCRRTGDNTRKPKDIWGWNDEDMIDEDRQLATVIN